jgi:hypothetical protein
MSYGYDLIWKSYDGNIPYPVIYATKEELEKELMSFDDNDDDTPAYIEIIDGIISVYTDETKEYDYLTISLDKWKNNC